MSAVQAKNGRRSNGLKMLLRMTGGVLQICINIIFYAAVVIMIIKAADFSYDFAYQVFGDVSVEAAPGRDVKVQILKGETSMNIAAKLEDSRVVVNKYSFYLKTKLKEYDIMPGTFILNTSMSYDEVLEVITDYSKSIDEEESVEAVESGP